MCGRVEGGVGELTSNWPTCEYIDCHMVQAKPGHDTWLHSTMLIVRPVLAGRSMAWLTAALNKECNSSIRGL